jgi:hypothetical protein
MMNLTTMRICSALAAAACISPIALGQLYSENFESDPTANWVVNNGPSDFAANFFFNYSTVGIPVAPHGGGTRGMKLQANLTNGIFSGMSVSPNGQSFTGDYTIRFDWWANFNGPFPLGGNGSTNLSTFGFGTTGFRPQWPGGVQDCVWFAATADGNSSADWRAYSTAAGAGYPPGSPVYAAAGADNRNSSHPYYSSFGSVAAPAGQLAMFPQQTGLTNVGCAGMEWHEVVIAKSGKTATWTVDGLLIVTIDLGTVTLSGENIFFGNADVNASSSTDVNDFALLFTLIDNIVVTGPCPCDFNTDGALNSQDFFDFLVAFFAQDASADFNNDTLVNSQDFFDFLGCFFSPPKGC